MRPADYSEEQIIEAGKGLEEEGKRVTPFGIRERMGGGQPQRIRTVWDSYVAGESAQEARQEQAVELPAEFAEQVQGMNAALIADLTTFAKRVYKRADEIAESRTREAMLAAKKAKENAETDVGEAERLIEDQDARFEALEGELAAVRTELDNAKRESRRLEKEKADEITAFTVANTRLGEQVNTAQSQTQAAEKALDTAVAERERERLSHEQERDRWEKDREALRAKAEQEGQQWSERLVQEKDQRDGLQKELERERAERKKAVRCADELRIETATLKDRAAHVEELRELLQKIQTKAPLKAASPGKRTRA